MSDARRAPRGVAGSIVLVLVTGVVAAAPDGAGDPSMKGLRVEVSPADLRVSFAIEDAFTAEIRERIDSGLAVTFQYDLEVVKRRALWFDKTLASRTVTTTVEYDTLTRQYSLSKKLNDEVTETSVAVDQADMERWMTHIDGIRLADPSTLQAEDGDLFVRVKARIQRRFILLFIPSSVGTSWEKVTLDLQGEGAGRAN